MELTVYHQSPDLILFLFSYIILFNPHDKIMREVSTMILPILEMGIPRIRK